MHHPAVGPIPMKDMCIVVFIEEAGQVLNTKLLAVVAELSFLKRLILAGDMFLLEYCSFLGLGLLNCGSLVQWTYYSYSEASRDEFVEDLLICTFKMRRQQNVR
ncbi:hypothetical protein QR680_008103 [Steinernema hermaphroditum]|uniref:Uncharacterized protein n=1 Tax=Steinernema hermaphroditum TaxID=289476 RepID=A0AA39IGU3_9BILA|nr:hypothetical protein QR680_008103 [Steinernema hermaphroditum]